MSSNCHCNSPLLLSESHIEMFYERFRMVLALKEKVKVPACLWVHVCVCTCVCVRVYVHTAKEEAGAGLHRGPAQCPEYAADTDPALLFVCQGGQRSPLRLS